MDCTDSTRTNEAQRLSIAKRNSFGVLDHHLSTYSGVEVFIPLRVLQNSNNESEMIFVGSNAL